MKTTRIHTALLKCLFALCFTLLAARAHAQITLTMSGSITEGTGTYAGWVGRSIVETAVMDTVPFRDRLLTEGYRLYLATGTMVVNGSIVLHASAPNADDVEFQLPTSIRNPFGLYDAIFGFRESLVSNVGSGYSTSPDFSTELSGSFPYIYDLSATVVYQSGGAFLYGLPDSFRYNFSSITITGGDPFAVDTVEPPISAVPEPSTYAIAGAFALGLLCLRKRYLVFVRAKR